MKHKELPDIEQLRNKYEYDAETGTLLNKSSRGKAKAGKPAGTLNSQGRIEIQHKGVKYLAHRIVWMLNTGKDPGQMTVDHIDRNPLNNRINNLRLATREQQCHNRDMRGIWQCNRTQKWRSQIHIKGKVISSTHTCPLLARLWYLDMKTEHHPTYSHR